MQPKRKDAPDHDEEKATTTAKRHKAVGTELSTIAKNRLIPDPQDGFVSCGEGSKRVFFRASLILDSFRQHQTSSSSAANESSVALFVSEDTVPLWEGQRKMCDHFPYLIVQGKDGWMGFNYTSNQEPHNFPFEQTRDLKIWSYSHESSLCRRLLVDLDAEQSQVLTRILGCPGLPEWYDCIDFCAENMKSNDEVEKTKKKASVEFPSDLEKLTPQELANQQHCDNIQTRDWILMYDDPKQIHLAWCVDAPTGLFLSKFGRAYFVFCSLSQLKLAYPFRYFIIVAKNTYVRIHS